MQNEQRYNFMRFRGQALILSLLLLAASLVGLAIKGLNFGIDFTGGTIIELAYDEPADVDAIRTALLDNGYERASVQNFGSAEEVLIRIAPRPEESSAQISNQVMDMLANQHNEAFELRRVEFVGPQVGDELTEDGALSLIYALIGVLIYVALRFEFRFSLGAVAALVHDVTITIGVFAWTQVQFDLTVLAAILAVIGYSLNDTIVVFDRVRENFRTVRDGTPVDVTNLAINQMLARTIMTSLTTLLVLVALIAIGGEVIYGFALALIVGVVVGTYSSMFVASSIALALGVSKEDLMKPVKEGEDASAQEEELHRIFLEEEARREAREAQAADKK
ncbi:MAG: protein translocase subunit SecF [Hydrogenovibrio sp.]|uniref:protein translocase subunit SecF n=1 Tax=Hydrogenovibrio sp. TaxID=2065821 RepID=UPI00287068C2|nr:protein translocase subunit SecF [Hydrogenovibrio sp.]MDR9497587.1 protein translocase subunit SecF [Hydrogenovibrio sp.]